MADEDINKKANSNDMAGTGAMVAQKGELSIGVKVIRHDGFVEEYSEMTSSVWYLNAYYRLRSLYLKHVKFPIKHYLYRRQQQKG